MENMLENKLGTWGTYWESDVNQLGTYLLLLSSIHFDT